VIYFGQTICLWNVTQKKSEKRESICAQLQGELNEETVAVPSTEHMDVALNFVTAPKQGSTMVMNLHMKEVNNTDNPANLLTIKSYPQSWFMSFSKESTSEMYIWP
jgi:hypothetical protein